ncbi:adhesion G protein-coupled receptor L3-like isoform X2 [Dysidea avara]|uniref:adhesion G protein-coupled receptor L3-like isoform X2 n=1 Tax=Dysidea avara TaxID=196820 RepID=UPI003326CD2A
MEEQFIELPSPNYLFGEVGNMTAEFQIPSTVILNQINKIGRRVSVVTSISRNIHLPTDISERVESLILSIQILPNEKNRISLSEPVSMTFNIGMPGNVSRVNPHCEFFVISNTSGQSGMFSTDGIIQSDTTNNSFVQCSTTHLTSFAVLVDVSGVSVMDNAGQKALSITSYIGCAISIVSLLFTIVVLVLFRESIFNHVQHFIHLNLCIALLLGLIAFVSGIETASDYRTSCLIVAILLHYFFMAAFSWMLCEGILLFISLRYLFYEGAFLSRKFFFLTGWGLPIPIVIASAAISHDKYGINDRCWISEEKGAIWAFIGPMLLIIMVNLFFLTFVTYKVYTSKSNKERAVKVSALDTAKSMIKAAIIVTPLLGCTWVFGLFAVNEHTVVFAWIFTILNSVQGFAIMYFYVVRDETFRKKIKGLICGKATHGSHSFENAKQYELHNRSRDLGKGGGKSDKSEVPFDCSVTFSNTNVTSGSYSTDTTDVADQSDCRSTELNDDKSVSCIQETMMESLSTTQCLDDDDEAKTDMNE